MKKSDRNALAILGAVAAGWFLLGRGGGASVGPSPATPPAGHGEGYAGSLYAVPPEPMAADHHDVWELSPDARRAVSVAPSLPYVRGGPFIAANCATVATPHARDLAALVREIFPWVRTIGDVRCGALHGSDRMDIHAEGRALDIMLTVPPQVYGDRAGEQLANWLVTNAQALGVQLVIWNRRRWQGSMAPATRGSMAPATRFAPYTIGRNVTTEHRNHVHAEVIS